MEGPTGTLDPTSVAVAVAVVVVAMVVAVAVAVLVAAVGVDSSIGGAARQQISDLGSQSLLVLVRLGTVHLRR